MVLLNDSLTVVLLGDWNKLYTQTDWVADNIFETPEMEIGFIGQVTDYKFSYKSDSVIITPEQSKIVFAVNDLQERTLGTLCKCVTNYLTKAHTPTLLAYGLNADFQDDDCLQFAEVVDSLSDSSSIIESGYEIASTEITRVLKCNDKIINMNSKFKNQNLYVHFNEHHELKENNKATFVVEEVYSFLNECIKILQNLGYDLEGDVV